GLRDGCEIAAVRRRDREPECPITLAGRILWCLKFDEESDGNLIAPARLAIIGVAGARRIHEERERRDDVVVVWEKPVCMLRGYVEEEEIVRPPKTPARARADVLGWRRKRSIEKARTGDRSEVREAEVLRLEVRARDLREL